MKHRLSKLQKIILETLSNTRDEMYESIYYNVRRKYGIKPAGIDIEGNKYYYDSNLKSSFSRSIRNLEKKGLIRLERTHLKTYYRNSELKDYWYTGSKKVSDIKLTNKGLLSISFIDIKEVFND